MFLNLSLDCNCLKLNMSRKVVSELTGEKLSLKFISEKLLAQVAEHMTVCNVSLAILNELAFCTSCYI